MRLLASTGLAACLLAVPGAASFAETLRGLNAQTPQARVTGSALSLADGEAYRIVSSTPYEGGVLLEVVPAAQLADPTAVQVCHGRVPRFIALVPVGKGAARTTDMRYFAGRPAGQGAEACLVTHYVGRR